VVRAFWTGAWNLVGQPPHVTELLSDPCINLVFEAGSGQAGSRVVGVWTQLWRRTLEGAGRVRGVKLRGGAARAFLPAPAFQFTNRITPLRQVFGREVARLEREVLGPADDGEAFEAFGAWLIRRRREDPHLALAVALVERIAADPAITTMGALAEVAGLSPRELQRLFRDHVGASPKWAIRRNRLQEAALRIERGDLPSLAALAAELGYADQAHLARDFRHAVGKSPSAFAQALAR
jgi:AraC-like DNA-binding protein